MSHQCPKCLKSLSTKRSLNNHLKKNLPCDLQCRLCDHFPFNSRQAYYKHMKTHTSFKDMIANRHPIINPCDDEEDVEDIPRMTTPVRRENRRREIENNMIPFDDFNELYREMLKKANDDNCEVNININININIRPLQNEERMRKVLNSLDNSAYMSSLQSLSSVRQLEDVAVEVLDKVHADEEKPENHSICLADPSRKTTKIFSRAEDDRCGWILHQRDDCIKKLNSHSTDLISILLEGAMEKLQDAVYIRDYKEKSAHNKVFAKDCIPCVCVTDDKEYIMICFDRESDICGFLEEVPLTVEYIDAEDIFAPGSDNADKFEKLRETIKERKEQIFEKLKDLVIDEKHLIEFLRKSRVMCLETHASHTRSANSLKLLK